MRAAVAVSLSLCWLWAAGHSLPRLRLSYRGEPGRGHLLRAGARGGRDVHGGMSSGSGGDLGSLSCGRCSRSAGFFGAAGGQMVLGAPGGAARPPPLPTRDAAVPRGEEEEGREEPGDGVRGCAASHGGSSPRRSAGKLRHGGLLAPARFGWCAGWVLPCVGGCSASCPRLAGEVPGLHPPSPVAPGCGCWGAGAPRGLRGQCLVLIKTLLTILLWLAASPALPT